MEEFFQKKLVFLITALVLIVVFVGLISAGFQLGSGGEGNYSIEKVYGPEFNLTGWINVSFDEEPLDSLFEDDFENSITLGELLEINSYYLHNCSTKDCVDDYSPSNEEEVKIINLTSGSSELVGFLLTGNIKSINSISFDVESNSSETSCASPLKVDILDDGIIESKSETLVNDLCSSDEKDYGCFDITQTTGINEFLLHSGGTYCQKINLSESPGFRIGAWLKEIVAGELTMTLYKDYGSEVDNCILLSITSEAENFCDISYSTSGGDHYLCISSGAGTGKYYIRGEASPISKCGFYGRTPPSEGISSYQMFAKSKKFGSPETQNLVNNLGDGVILSTIVDNYLRDRYGTIGGKIQCLQGCVVPLNLISGLNQEVTLKNLVIEYEISGAGVFNSKKIYGVAKVPAKVSSNFQKLYLNNAGFTLPSKFGNHSFSLSLNGETVFSEEIEIKNAPVIGIIKPTETAVAFPTEFEAKVFSSENITRYKWEFGDNSSSKTTVESKTTHTYSSIGIYDLRITVTDSKDISSSRNFSINVSSARDLIEDSLVSLNSKVAKIKKDINKLDLFHRQGIESVLGLDSIEAELEAFEKAFNSSTSEENYSAIIVDLIKIQLPQGIIKTVSAEGVSFFDTQDNVDMDALKEIGGGSYGPKESAYRNSVLAWQAQNINIKIDFNEFSDEETTNSIVKIFEIEISEKKNIDHNYYLVIPDLENIKFKNNVQTQGNGYSYIILNGDSRVSFYTTEDVDFISLPVFVAPPISKLSVVETFNLGDEKESRSNLIVILVIILLGVLSLTVYIIMQEWYKRKYESYLFKNKNDLYNMVNYVNSAKKKGLKKEEIKKNLKEAGWSSERVKFVMKKYAGKRTGMLGIPIGKIIKKVDKNSNNKTTT